MLRTVEANISLYRTLKARQLDTWSQFPRGLTYHLEELNHMSDMRQVYIKILVHLEHLKNVFFAERLLLLHGQRDEGDIILTSFIMLSRVLLFWTHRERFSHPSIRRNFEWLVRFQFLFP